MSNKFSTKKARYLGLIAMIITFATQVCSNYLYGIPDHGKQVSTAADVLFYVSLFFFVLSIRLLVFGIQKSKRIIFSSISTFILLPIIMDVANILYIIRNCPCPDTGLGLAIEFIFFIIPCTLISGVIAFIPFGDYASQK